MTPFFNPRTQEWRDHFNLEGSAIIPLTAEGRVTALILQLNEPQQLQERRRLLTEGQDF